MATKHTDSCLMKAADDEPIFVLRAQDALAGGVVRFWANCAEQNGCPDEKVAEARALAYRMDHWAVRKMPD